MAHRLGSLSTGDTVEAMCIRACDPYRSEPDLNLCLEIAEYVNSKKANTPREAALATIRLVNNRNQHVSMLALGLLDILVKNCGYPFQLQIGTKEFLNELVRRFPERPPAIIPPPMAKILELIQEWKSTICFQSKYKEDLVHIRDMHRLLGYKGYRFPQVDQRSAAVLNPSDTLKSPDELEEEDRVAQGAKLQELIRRGTPKDLAAAQQLMKLMSGAEPGKRPDYEAQTAKELNTIQHRAITLNDMLSNARPNERFVEGDAYYQLAQRCKQVQPRIQKWIQESEESDPERTEKLLLINDLLNQVLKRYNSFLKGDRSAVAIIDPSLLEPILDKNKSNSQPAKNQKAPKAKKAQPQNLIDFDDFANDTPAPAPATSTSTPNPFDDDLGALAGLSITPEPSQRPAATNGAILDLFGPSSSSSSAAPANQGLANISWNSHPQQAQQARDGASIFNSSPAVPGAISLPSGRSGSSPSPATPNYFSTPASNSPAQGSSTNAMPGKAKDPFEDLLA